MEFGSGAYVKDAVVLARDSLDNSTCEIPRSSGEAPRRFTTSALISNQYSADDTYQDIK